MQEAQVLATLEQYTSARDFFAATQNAAKEIEAAALTLERLHVRELPHAQSYSPKITGASASADPSQLNATDVRILFEERTRLTIEADRRLLDAGAGLMFGSENASTKNEHEDGGSTRAGVYSLVGFAAADVVFQRAIQARKWAAIAHACGRSVAWCKLRYNVVCDTVDAYGWRACVRGVVEDA